MQHLVKHLISNNLEGIVADSFLNCHVQGMHSIMLLNSPEKTIRLYIATDGHELWRNDMFKWGKVHLSLGFHPHHCNLTLHCIQGYIHNWSVVESTTGFMCDKYIYQSEINGGGLGFKKLEGTYKLNTAHDGTTRDLVPGQTLALDAKVIHTVWAQKGRQSAWLVYEGKEDPNYVPHCYSNADLTKPNEYGLYSKPTEQQVIELLTSAKLISQ